MLLLFETPAGFALFKVLDEGKLSKVEVYLVGTLFVILAAWYYFLTLFSFFFIAGFGEGILYSRLCQTGIVSELLFF